MPGTPNPNTEQMTAKITVSAQLIRPVIPTRAATYTAAAAAESQARANTKDPMANITGKP